MKNIHYSIIFLTIFAIGISNVISLVEESSEEESSETSLLDVAELLLSIIPDSLCDFFNDVVIKKWRRLAEDLTETEVDFHPYYNSDESNDSDNTSDYSDETFRWSEDDSHFDPTINRTTIIIHGYLDNHKNEWIQSLKDALLDWRKSNMAVIAVDWAKSFNYHTAAGAVDEVAEEIYEKLVEFAEAYDNKSIARPYLHIMGHSLGAHIAGLTAKKLKEKFNWFVNRVTGFDPAKPFFDKGDFYEEYRLDKSHAQFVDVIHTNSAPNTSTFGLYDALGHIDFYPNGGDYQPACAHIRGKKSNSKRSKKSDATCPESDIQECFSGLGKDISCIVSSFVVEKENMICDHALGQEYFRLSLKKGHFKHSAVRFHDASNYSNTKCNDKCCKKGQISMGIYASHCGNSTHNGRYYVKVSK